MERKKLLCIAFAIFLSACQQGPSSSTNLSQNSLNEPVHENPSPADAFSFKSPLSFTGVVWPEFTNSEKFAMSVALNITGSFEGSKGWNNLTNNFDGQGMSFGLLNQNFGTGTLQPLLLQMKARFFQTFASQFSQTHFETLSNMLETWGRSLSLSTIEDDLADPVSPLDEDFETENLEMMGVSDNLLSVGWAKSNLFVGTQFKSSWRHEFLGLGVTPQYISIQLDAATSFHDRSLAYLKTLKWQTLRAYLFVFDVIIQNGGFYQKDISDFKTWKASLSAEPSEKQQMQKLLLLRLTHVKAKYVADVKARKQAIILGKGTVHQTPRDFEREYGISLSRVLF